MQYESVMLWGIFCITIVALTSIAAITIYNKDKLELNLKAKTMIKDKVNNELGVNVKQGEKNAKK